MLRSLHERIRQHCRRQGPWVLIDQAVVSGGNFLIGILLARFLGPESFGAYVLLQAVMLYLNSFQGALIFQPMLSAAPQLSDEGRVHYLQGIFALQLILSAVMAGVVLLLGLLASFLAGLIPLLAFMNEAGAAPLLALASAVLAFQLQDWQRRYCFVIENSRGALLQDVLNYAIQVGLFTFAGLNGFLDVTGAFWIVALGSAIAFVVRWSRNRLRPVFAHARAVLHASWRSGRDYLIAWQFQWMGGQGVLVVGAGMVGAEAAGGVRAAQNIVGPVNIFFQAMENVVPIAAARRYASDGLTGLLAYLWRITGWGSAALLPVLLALSLWSEALTRLLYGEVYVAFSVLVIWHAASVLLQFYLRQAFFFLRTVQATGVILRAGILMAISSVLVALVAVPDRHASGVMMALLSGTAVALVYSADAIRRIVLSLGELNAAGEAR